MFMVESIVFEQTNTSWTDQPIEGQIDGQTEPLIDIKRHIQNLSN